MKNTLLSASLCGGVVFLGLAGFGKVVHTPAAAIASGQSPSVVAGAAWSVHRRVWWNDPNPATSALSFTNTRADGLVGWVKVSQQAWDFVPCVLVNNTASPIASTDIMGNGDVAIDLIQPGEVVMHPGVQSSSELNRAVLRFAVPRNGLYSLSALFRALNGETFVSKVIDVSVLLDGVLLYQTELSHPDNVTRKTCSFDKMYLTAGQALEIAVGSGLTESSTPSHQGDAVGIKLTIVEEDETIDPIAGCWDLATAFAAEAAKGTPAVPFSADDKGSDASWAFYDATASSFFFEYSAAAVMAKWARDGSLDGSRVSKNGGASETEHVTVYNPAATTSAMAGLGSDGSGLFTYPDRIAPGEVSMHPDNNDREVIVRFVVPADGRYVADYSLRDVSRANAANVNDQSGVSLHVLAGGVSIGESTDVSLEHGTPFAFRQFVTPPLKAGAAVDFILQNRGAYHYDGTAGRIRVLKLAADTPVSDGCAATALRANATGANANPFTDSTGATWTMAKSTSPTGAGFAAFAGNATTTRFVQKNYTGNDTLYSKLPFINVNTTLESVGHSVDATIENGQILFPNEFHLHPCSDKSTKAPFYTVLRYTAPARGIYAFRVTARDIHPAGSSDGNAVKDKCGVEVCLARPDGTYLDRGYANADANDAKCWALLEASCVYLEAGESVDMSVGPKSGRQTTCDATAVSENVRLVSDAQGETMAAVDICTTAASSSRYVARGRVGWADLSWTKTCADGVQLKASDLKVGEDVTRTVFTLTRTSGEAMTPAALKLGELMNDGVTSEGAGDTYQFEIANLVPNARYTLYFYGVSASNGAVPTFTVAGESVSPSLVWSRPDVPEVAVLSARADASGAISGTFSSDREGESAFCGLQIAGESFRPYRGMAVIVR